MFKTFLTFATILALSAAPVTLLLMGSWVLAASTGAAALSMGVMMLSMRQEEADEE